MKYEEARNICKTFCEQIRKRVRMFVPLGVESYFAIAKVKDE